MIRPLLGALGIAAALAACDREPERTPPAPLRYVLAERTTPGDHTVIAEVLTVDTITGLDHAELGRVEVRHESELAKEVALDVVQVDLDGQPTRYRKRFRRYRSRTTTTLGDESPVVEAEIHPLEGHTVEHVLGPDDTWTVRATDGALDRDELPTPRDGARHPWLPEGPVAVGEQWAIDALPFALPVDAHVQLTGELVEVSPRELGWRATVGVTGALRDLEGRELGRVAARVELHLDAPERGGRIAEVRVDGSLVDDEAGARTTTTFRVYRAIASE